MRERPSQGGTAPLSRRTLLRAAGGLAATAVLSREATAATTVKRPPNILFILADDLGYADLGCYGGRDHPTPVLDRLAADGVRLINGYSNSSVCSPTRMALITGRYQYRIASGLEEPIAPFRNAGLPAGTTTMPSLLKSAGYRTALIGKWHLGDPPLPGPLDLGYDRFFGIRAGGSDYFTHDLEFNGHNYAGMFDGDNRVDVHGYMTDLLAERAISEIGAGKDDRPFFVSLHFTAPHWPWQGPGDANDKRTMRSPTDFESGSIAKYAEMVSSLDRNIGRVLDALERTGQAENTIVIFTSDNGGERFSDTWPFLGMKTELLEGGIRVPLIMRWPRQIPAGSNSDQVMISMDFLPTLLAAAGAKFTPSQFDGTDLLPILTGKAPLQHRTLYWRHKAGDQRAVRDGDWKYLRIGDQEHLFNLAEDSRERAERKNTDQAIFSRLKADFDRWNATMLPYSAETYSHSAKYDDHLADRY